VRLPQRWRVFWLDTKAIKTTNSQGLLGSRQQLFLGKYRRPAAHRNVVCFPGPLAERDDAVRRKFVPILVLAFLSLFTPIHSGAVEPETTGHQWAAAINVAEPQNVHKVSDQLYRGGEVSRAGAEQLRCLGINTAVSLRLVGRDSRYITREGLNYVHIPVKAWQPNEDEVVQFLRVAVDPKCQPVYVYCHHGSDRTGMMCAVYRVVVQGWSKEEAICEMTEGPFGYHPIWKKVVQFVRDMDVERIRGLVIVD
jgi:tyrosine-protein phosphatase SIW14